MKKLLAILLITFLLISSVGVAQVLDSYDETFNDPNPDIYISNNYLIEQSSPSNNDWTNFTIDEANDNYALELSVSPNFDPNSRITLTTDQTYTANDTGTKNVTARYWANWTGTDDTTIYGEIGINDGNASSIQFGLRPEAVGNTPGTTGWFIDGSMVDSDGDGPTTSNGDTGWVDLRLEIDYDNNQVKLFKDDIQMESVMLTSEWSEPNNITVNYRAEATVAGRFHWVRYDNIESSHLLQPIEGALNVSADTYMDFNSSQTYEATFKANDGKTYDLTDKDSLIVESNNTSVVTIDKANNKIISHGNESLVNVTFSTNNIGDFENQNKTIEIFVGNATMANIEFLPGYKKTEAYLGTQDMIKNNPNAFGGFGKYGIGSNIQLVLFLLLICGSIVKLSNNVYIGFGLMNLLMIMGWVFNRIALGLVLLTIFYTIWVSIIVFQRQSFNVNVYTNQ